jgi:hypothetical protein
MEPIPASEWERYNRGALDMIVHKVGKIDVLVEATRKLEEQQVLGQKTASRAPVQRVRKTTRRA